MKITFTSHKQRLTATRIIRCRVKDFPISFHVAVYGDEVAVYSPNTEIACYEVDDKNIEVSSGH